VPVHGLVRHSAHWANRGALCWSRMTDLRSAKGTFKACLWPVPPGHACTRGGRAAGAREAASSGLQSSPLDWRCAELPPDPVHTSGPCTGPWQSARRLAPPWPARVGPSCAAGAASLPTGGKAPTTAAAAACEQQGWNEAVGGDFGQGIRAMAGLLGPAGQQGASGPGACSS
jgi:hypothetical protein